MAGSQRGSHVRAHVIDGVIVSLIEKDGNDLVFYLKSQGLPFRYFTDAGNRDEFKIWIRFHSSLIRGKALLSFDG